MIPNEPDHQLAPVPKKQKTGFDGFDKALDENPLFQVGASASVISELDVDKIQTNPGQPRTQFDEESLQELADTIREHGLINPVTVSDNGDGTYTLIAGERRLRAHQLLGRETIQATVSEGDRDVVAIIENVQREQLDPIEEAHAYLRLMETHGYSQGQVADLVGKSRNTINEVVSIGRLSPAVIARCRTSDTPLSTGVLVEIAKVENEGEQLAILDDALSRRLGVRAVRQRRKEMSASPTPSIEAKPASVSAANARKDRLIRSLHATAKRLREDARVEDFPAGSEALDRVRELRDEIIEQLDRITEQARLNED